jgi:hypothetical protein
MKIKNKCAAIAVLIVAITFETSTIYGQGFMNLNFEQASVAPAPLNYTPSDAQNPICAASALPYWTVTEDGTVCTAVWGEPVALDETSVALVAASANPIQGNYSVQLSAYADAPSDLYRSSSISQTGLIPIGTQSIQFLIASPTNAGSVPPNPTMTLNGSPISLSVVSQSGGVMTMGGNVSAFAGDTATLAFLCQATTGASFPANENYFNLDNIQFSTSPVPEPSEIALTALGALFLCFRRWRKPSL